MSEDSVRNSRDGDEFHYRWAARRCLNMIYPKSNVVKIFIERSNDPKLPGELVIDVCESIGKDEDNIEEIIVYQLKHTTVRKEKDFTLSELKKTIIGFADRYRANLKTNPSQRISFKIITNRPISLRLKNKLKIFIVQGTIDTKTKKKLETFTKLTNQNLIDFCKALMFVDDEGDFEEQKFELRKELAILYTGKIDSLDINNLVNLVRDEVFSTGSGVITKTKVLQRISGIEHENILYPAPPEYDELNTIFKREQQDELLKAIIDAENTIILEADGGVGKSVIANQLALSIPEGSLGIVFDCFGNGKYLRSSETRHKHEEALVQIANEISRYTLSTPMIAGKENKKQLMRHFLIRLNEAINILRDTNKDAILAIFIDAADNSVMAAEKFGEKSFVPDLLEEEYPEGCKIVMLCRSERTKLLRPIGTETKLLLKPFSLRESQVHLRKTYPETNEKEAMEFHRLTNNGNPRVQANALEFGNTFQDVLMHLGPTGKTVQDQIEDQLNLAIDSIKKQKTNKLREEIDNICIGLATLPPFIPIEILAKSANIEVSTIRSFLNELGRPFLITDNYVQFRDEPTETWFRNEFVANNDTISNYVELLKPFANTNTYVSETLPSLLLQAGKLKQLIELALSDDYLPEVNPLDKRNVRVYRLQFAFRAALKKKKFVDAIKIAFLAGEEVAGETRQLALLQRNIDLIAPLQDNQKVQELASKGLISGEWKGSKNLYSASLFSTVQDYEGEARSYLRAAHHWIELYFEDIRNSDENRQHFRYNLDDDFVEFVFAHYNLNGVEAAIEMLLRFRPDQAIYKVTRKFIRRLVDMGNFNSIKQMLQIELENKYLIIGIVEELFNVGVISDSRLAKTVLSQLDKNGSKVDLSFDSLERTTTSSIISFLEVCASNKLPKTKIIRVLKKYSSLRANRIFSDQIFEKNDRQAHLKTVALLTVFQNKKQPAINQLLPKQYIAKNKTDRRYEREREDFAEVINILLPWYILRARVLVDDVKDLSKSINDINKKVNEFYVHRWKENDSLPNEISALKIDIISFYKNVSKDEAKQIYQLMFSDSKNIWIQDHFKFLRNACRLEHLSEICMPVEEIIRDYVSKAKEEYPETRADWYVEIARAVLVRDKNDAAFYFERAIEAVAKFGDEIVQRWSAISALAKKTSEDKTIYHKLAYRFIRCAEQVGEFVGREKYWDRNKAIELCARLSPQMGMSSLSRWRDRNVGWFSEQIIHLAKELVKNNIVPAKVGWVLTPFFRNFGLDDFACLAIETAHVDIDRNYILNSAIRFLRLNEASSDSWMKLKEITDKNSLINEELEDIIKFYKEQPEIEHNSSNHDYSYSNNLNMKPPNWNIIFEKLELKTTEGIVIAFRRFDEVSDNYRHKDDFWIQLYNRVFEDEALDFLHSLSLVSEIGRYEIKYALRNIPKSWLNKVSVKENLPKILRDLSNRLCLDLTNENMFYSFLIDVPNIDEYITDIQDGFIEGLSNNSSNIDEQTYFGFVEIASDLVSPKQAVKLLDFGLHSIENHIDEDFADGVWSLWLKPPDNISEAFTGFLWSALGSPVAKVRWQAAHAVRILCETSCKKEISALIQWLIKDRVDSFGAKEFPFYNLHSRLYLLIVFARVSIDYSEILKPYSDVFSKIALNDIPHILIQKFASEIALNIEKKFPKTYNNDTVKKLGKVGISQQKIKGRNEIKNSQYNPLDDGGEFRDKRFNTGYDMPKYWFNSLSRIFDLSIREIDDLIINVIVDEWNIKGNSNYKDDPRNHLWKHDRSDFNTHHSHGAYPRTDDYSFYLSYHAMFIVAKRLLDKYPIIEDEFSWDNPWIEWLNRHSLTRTDGCWVADRRDPAPLIKPVLDKNIDLDEWVSKIEDWEYFDKMVFKKNGDIWFKIYGEWTESDEYRWNERIVISSSMVPVSYSQSLLNALSTYLSPRDFYLPYYEENEVEIDFSPFKLTGWIEYNQMEHKLDQYDPFANEIKYSALEVGKDICKKMKLNSDSEKRNWYLHGKNYPVVISQVWSTNPLGPDRGQLRYGNCISISLYLLKRICKEYNSDLIIEVQIDRTKKENRRSGISYDYKQPANKIFLFTKEGRLRDTEKNYKIG